MVQSGSGEIGAAKLTGEVLDIVAKVPEMVKNMTGVNIMKVNYFSGIFFNQFSITIHN